MAVVRMSTKGQIVIPAEMRKRRGWKPGCSITIDETEEGLVLREVEELIRATRGMFRHLGGKSLSQELLEERRREVEMEEAQYPHLFGKKTAPARKESSRPSR